MTKTCVTRDVFLEDRQGKTFADVVNDPEQPFDAVLEFFRDAGRQRRMEESELHHDRSPLAGVVRELESQPNIDQFLAGAHVRRNTRFRQAIGVLVRMIMERRGWRKTGRKGSLGVRASGSSLLPHTIQEDWLFGSFGPSDMNVMMACPSAPFENVAKRSSQHLLGDVPVPSNGLPIDGMPRRRRRSRRVDKRAYWGSALGGRRNS